MSDITAQDLIAVAKPALARGDVQQLVEALTDRWTDMELCSLLTNPDPAVRRLVCVSLGFIGGQGVLGHLTRSLHDTDAEVLAAAEDAIWSIWFRMSKPAAQPEFKQGLALLDTDEWDHAIERFQLAARIDPTFAEAYHQLGLAYYLAERWHEAEAVAKRTLSLVPAHFAALALLGHCHAHLGNMHLATDCYRRSLAIHPHMPAISEALDTLRSQRNVSSTTGPLVTAELRQFDTDI